MSPSGEQMMSDCRMDRDRKTNKRKCVFQNKKTKTKNRLVLRKMRDRFRGFFFTKKYDLLQIKIN